MMFQEAVSLWGISSNILRAVRISPHFVYPFKIGVAMYVSVMSADLIARQWAALTLDKDECSSFIHD
uniref:Putative ovule protein n=1 Tax=Solanum chacoense TaxID=4108 RepID=A0A0V0GGX1_SOLCH